MKEPYVEATNRNGDHLFSAESFVVLAKTGGSRSTDVEVFVSASQSETFLLFVSFGMALAKRGLLDESMMRLRSAVNAGGDAHPHPTHSATITA